MESEYSDHWRIGTCMGNTAANKALELKKHVNAIHCSNNLSLIQRKLFNALLYNAYPALLHKQKFEIKGKELYRLIGYNSKDTAKLKEALIGLITIAIQWNVLDCSTGHEKKWKASSILASAELSNGICIYEYSQVMKELLYQPDIYGQINIDLISRFKSSYGLALYENCIRYKGLTQTPWFSLDIFKKLMGVFEGKYQVFKDFKKRVLDVAVNEVNNLSSIRIIPEIERANQKVTKIRFKIIKNIENSQIQTNPKILDEDLNEILIKTFGFSIQMLDEIYEKYETAFIREKVEMIMLSENFLTGKIRGVAGYLIEALKKNYKQSRSSKAINEEKSIILNAKKIEDNEKQIEIEKRYLQYKNKKVNAYLENLGDIQKDQLVSEFENFLQSQNKIVVNWYRTQGLNHPATKGCFVNFIVDTRQNEVWNMISMEEYVDLIEGK